MSGSYILCGEFSGADKSGSPIYEVFDDISESLSSDHEPQWKELVRGIKNNDETDNVMFRISQSESIELIPILNEYIEKTGSKYLEKYGSFTSPFETLPEEFENVPNVSGSEFRDIDKYICAEELLRACEVSAETADDVIIYHDHLL